MGIRPLGGDDAAREGDDDVTRCPETNPVDAMGTHPFGGDGAPRDVYGDIANSPPVVTIDAMGSVDFAAGNKSVSETVMSMSPDPLPWLP